MKKFTFLLTLLSFLSLSNVQAQDADAIVSNYLELIGGEDKMAALKSMKSSGMAKAQGMDIAVTMLQAAPNKMRMDMELQGNTVTQACFDGTKGWSTNFMTMEPEAWDQEQCLSAKLSSDFPDNMVNYKDKGYAVSYEGEEDVEGTASHKIKLTKPTSTIGDEEVTPKTFYYFDKDSGVLLKQTDFMLVGPQKGMAMDTYFSDYDEVEGLMLPFSVSQTVNGVEAFSFKAEKIELNSELPSDHFDIKK